MEWDWAVIKTLAGARPVSLYEVLTSKQHWCALLLSSSLSLVPNFVNASSGGKCDIFLTFRYKHIARRLASNINYTWLATRRLTFYFNGRFFFFTFTSLALPFFFPSLDEKEITSGKVDRLPLSSHHILHYDTILPSARSLRWLLFWFLLWIIK